jgi:hypothetical protein
MKKEKLLSWKLLAEIVSYSYKLGESLIRRGHQLWVSSFHRREMPQRVKR